VPTGVLEAVIQKQDQLAAQLQATQALFAPQAWYGIAAARAGQRLADASVENTRREILFGVAQAYYGAAGLKQVVKIQQRQLAIGLDRERDARVRYEAGTTAKVALLRAEIDRARAEQDLKRAQNSLISAKLALAALLDRDDAAFEVEIPASPEVPGAEARLEEAALRDRPDLRAAQEQVTVNEKNRDAVVARYLPTLGAFGRYVYSNAAGFGGQSTTWAVGLALNWNLLDGFLRESDLRENRARVREAQAAREAAEIRARLEVRQARLDLESALANREKAKEQAELARENQRLVDVNYRAGAATYLEVSDANAALLSAELSAVNEALSADLSALRLLRAAGAFDPK
jgi:outer membrane protein TolC